MSSLVAGLVSSLVPSPVVLELVKGAVLSLVMV